VHTAPEDICDIIQVKAATKCQQNDAERCRLRGIFKARAKADRNNHLSSTVDEVEEDLQHNNMKSAIRAIKTLAGQKHSPVLHPQSRWHTMSLDGQDMQHWSELITAALNHLLATNSTFLESASISAVLHPNVRTDEPTVDEDTRAIKKLKMPVTLHGSDGIPPNC